MRKRLKPIHDKTRLCDLASWEDLFGYCVQCGKVGYVDKARLLRRYGTNAVLKQISGQLVCRACGARKGNEFGMSNRPRD